jgi:hypothetical protein
MSVTATPSRPPISPILYDWPRFWIPQTGILDLSDAGFLRDPVDSLYGSGSLRTLSQLETYPGLALLGEPGIGKSATLTGEHDRVSALPPEQGVHSVYVDLNATSSEDRLYRHIFESAEMAAWKAGNTRLCLHLDSLDEAMLRIETVPHLLCEGIRTLPADRLSLRIACRTAIWPAATLGRTLTNIWGEAGLGVYELAPLRRRDVLTALQANDIDPDDFISKLFGAQAVAFAIKPLTLKMVIGAKPGVTDDFAACHGSVAYDSILACRRPANSLIYPVPSWRPSWWASSAMYPNSRALWRRSATRSRG